MTQEHLPIFSPQIGDVNQLNKHVDVIDMSSHRNPAASLGEHLEEFLTSPDIVGGNADLAHYRNKLNNGGTLITSQVLDLARQSVDIGNHVTALRTRLGHPADTAISIKGYKSSDKKGGLAPHRDANFSNSGPGSVVDAIGLRGNREFALWAMPQTVDLGLSDADFMRVSDRGKAIVEFAAKLAGVPTIFRPVRTHTFGAGQGVRIDEKRGVWNQPNGRPMAVWHSVYGIEDEANRPVLTAVMRSSNPRKP